MQRASAGGVRARTDELWAWRRGSGGGFVSKHTRVRSAAWARRAWKLSNLRCGSASSKARMVSQGPSPTPTMTTARGQLLEAATSASTVSFSWSLSWPSGTSALRVTWPSAMRSSTWKVLPAACVTAHACRMMGPKLVGPLSRTAGVSRLYSLSASAKPIAGRLPSKKLNTLWSPVLTSPKP